MKHTMHNPKIRNGTGPGTALWQRIENFSLDEAGVDFPFSRKLAKENNWDIGFTTAAITEYKKFVYLCCILPQGASPSYIVDQVWHMHLIYTQNYWDLFCEKILQRKLHHHPSTGGQEERQKHDDWQEDTLEQYRHIFGTEPPPHIWTHQPVPKPATRSFIQRLRRKIFNPLSFLLLSIFLSGCGGGSLAFFILGVFVLFVSLFSHASRQPGQQQKKEGNTGSSDSGGGSSCSSSGCSSGGCGSGCGGGGCGGCGGS